MSMKKSEALRRSFLTNYAAGLGSAWLASRWTGVLDAQEHVQQAVKSGLPAKLQFFSADQAAEVDAVTAQIIPSDGTPGAREAHSIHFIDRALGTFDRDKQAVYTQGLKDLEAKTREMFPGKDKFSSLTSAQQIQLLTSIERTPFFALIRLHTVVGFVANPEYGGNDNKVGWNLLGFEDKFDYRPPFGYYDGLKANGKVG
jgi:gluconate 2-dehydrogenase gamma chain